MSDRSHWKSFQVPVKVYPCFYCSLPKAALFRGINSNKQIVRSIWERFSRSRSHRWSPLMTPSSSLASGPVFPLPSLCSVWTEESQCTLVNASITETFNCSFSCGPDCWKLSQYPCLQVYVNLTSSGEKLLLYHTEETMKINQKVGAWHTHTAFRPPPPQELPRSAHLPLKFPCASISKENTTRKQALPHLFTELFDSCLGDIYFLCMLQTNHSPILW